MRLGEDNSGPPGTEYIQRDMYGHEREIGWLSQQIDTTGIREFNLLYSPDRNVEGRMPGCATLNSQWADNALGVMRLPQRGAAARARVKDSCGGA